MSVSPGKTFRWVRRVFLVVVVILIVQFVVRIEVRKVAEDDWSTPAAPPGRVLLVRSVERDEGEVLAGNLYFVQYEWPTGSGERSLRLARVVGVGGEVVVKEESGVTIAERPVGVRPIEVLGWPDRVPDGEVLILTDEHEVLEPRELHPDSRQLGPIPEKWLRLRVVAPMPF